jgi:hypothetical protein
MTDPNPMNSRAYGSLVRACWRMVLIHVIDLLPRSKSKRRFRCPINISSAAPWSVNGRITMTRRNCQNQSRPHRKLHELTYVVNAVSNRGWPTDDNVFSY